MVIHHSALTAPADALFKVDGKSLTASEIEYAVISILKFVSCRELINLRDWQTDLFPNDYPDRMLVIFTVERDLH